jgi:NADH:ubiquinone oxidoreductase subunit 3 (subunit A)
MNIVYILALCLIVPVVLLASSLVVCEKDPDVTKDDPLKASGWSFDPLNKRCDAAYLTIIVVFCAVMVFLAINSVYQSGDDF